MQNVASLVLNAFLMSVVLVLLFRRAAPALGLIDLPDERKLHDGGVPAIGGIAMFGAFVTASSLHGPIEGGVGALVLGSAILVALGVVDDRFDLSPKIKLVGQFAAAGVFVFGADAVVRLDVLPGWGEASAFAVPFTLVFIVGTINAFNMIDGIDGLAGGAASSALFWLAVLAVVAGRPEWPLLLLLLAGVLGFLVFNLRHRWLERAAVFMGDAGSMMLGGAVAFFVAALAGGPEPAASFPALLWLCIVPIADTISLAVRRMQDGRSPFSPDREHLHHLVLRTGFGPRETATRIIATSFILGGIGTAGALVGAPDAMMLLGLVLVLLGHTAFVLRIGRERRASAGRFMGVRRKDRHA
jgi:UDP-GlcNAc:undecaprenyl-phosphate GlcNAc-1-phosphate transferase